MEITLPPAAEKKEVLLQVTSLLLSVGRLEDAESRKVSSVPRTPPPPDFKEGTAVPQVCVHFSVSVC